MSKTTLLPDGSILNSHANANLTWAIALGELIDNSFDANARTIAIDFSRGGMKVTDDGTGCPDPTAIIRLGSSAKHPTTKLGRYGIGGKEAALWIGGMDSSIHIESNQGGKRRELIVNWRAYSERWEIDTPSEFPADGDGIGTVIQVRPRVRPLPHGQRWKELIAQIGYLYAPALKQGRQIKIRRDGKGAQWEPVVRWELPPLHGQIIDTRVVVNGHGARVYCGVVQRGVPNTRSGFTYSHEWRVIEAASARGCGDHSAAQVCGFVELDATWPLTKNKDAISKGAEELYAAVEEAAMPVLIAAESIGTEIRSRQFETAVNERLNSMLTAQRAKAKRGKGDRNGSKQATGDGAKHTRADREQSGDTFVSAKSGRYLVDFVPLGDQDRIGEVKPPTQVLLNTDNPWIASIRGNDISAVLSVAAALIAAEHCYARNGQPILKGIDQGTTTSDISRAMGSILSKGLSVDGRSALKAVS